MATTIENVAEAMQVVLRSTAEAAAWNVGFTQRKSKLTGPAFIQTLTFGWLANPEATLEELAQTAGTIGVSISPQGLDQRFTIKGAAFVQEVLQAAVAQVLTADAVAIPLLQRFSSVTVLDSTAIALPDALADTWPSSTSETAATGRAGLKLQVRWDLLHGTLEGPFLHAGRSSDRSAPLTSASQPTGTLHLADLGYFSVERLQQLGHEQVYFLTRLAARTMLYDATGREWTISAFLKNQKGDLVDVPMQIGKTLRLPCRLVAVRVPPSVVAKRRERLQKRSTHRKTKPHPDSLTLTEWTLYVTNVPTELLNVREIQVLARCRWQIELLFKLWKQYGRIDESRSQRPCRVLCEVYAKLLGMIVQHWILLISAWSYADRSLAKAAKTVRNHALTLAAILGHRQLVCKTLEIIQRALKRGCRINKRVKQPPNFQLLLDLTQRG